MGLTPIIDGNVTIVIVAALLMGAFGPTDGFWGKVFNPIFFMFGPSTAGSIYLSASRCSPVFCSTLSLACLQPAL